MISRRDQVQEIASQLANLRFLDQGLVEQPDDRDPALVGDVKPRPRVKRRGFAGLVAIASLGMRFRPGRFSMIRFQVLRGAGGDRVDRDQDCWRSILPSAGHRSGRPGRACEQPASFRFEARARGLISMAAVPGPRGRCPIRRPVVPAGSRCLRSS